MQSMSTSKYKNEQATTLDIENMVDTFFSMKTISAEKLDNALDASELLEDARGASGKCLYDPGILGISLSLRTHFAESNIGKGI